MLESTSTGSSGAMLQVQDPGLHTRALCSERAPPMLSTLVGLLQLHWGANEIPSFSAIGQMI